MKLIGISVAIIQGIEAEKNKTSDTQVIATSILISKLNFVTKTAGRNISAIPNANAFAVKSGSSNPDIKVNGYIKYPIQSNIGVWLAKTIPNVPIAKRDGPILKANIIPSFKLIITFSKIEPLFVQTSIPSLKATLNFSFGISFSTSPFWFSK